MEPPERLETNVWEAGLLRLFISHSHTQRILAGNVKTTIVNYGIHAFVAHDDIAPTKEWETEIIAALKSCQALVALLSEDARTSPWVDQECGWAMARGVPVISVDAGAVPYGFLGRYQALPGAGKEPWQIADQIFQILLSDGATHWPLIEALVTSFESSGSFNQANLRFGLLQRAQPLAFDEKQLDRIEAAFTNNFEVAHAFDVQRGLANFLEVRRQAWKESWEQEKRDKYEDDR